MRARRLLLLALLAPAFARGEAAAPPAQSGPMFALRGGVGVPSGPIASTGPDVADLVSRKVPFGVDIGYRFGPRIWAELHFEFAPATPAASLCAAGASCSASDVRFGALLALRLLPGRRVDPWLGAGVGAEVLEVEGRDAVSAAHVEWSWAGVELPFVEAGLDVALSDRVGLGPFASLSFVRFTSASARADDGAKVSGAVTGRAVHRWVSAGLRVTVRL